MSRNTAVVVSVSDVDTITPEAGPGTWLARQAKAVEQTVFVQSWCILGNESTIGQIAGQ